MIKSIISPGQLAEQQSYDWFGGEKGNNFMTEIYKASKKGWTLMKSG